MTFDMFMTASLLASLIGCAATLLLLVVVTLFSLIGDLIRTVRHD